MEKILLVKYGEIAIRGKNRWIIENKLIAIIERNLSKLGRYSVIKEQGRFLVRSLDEEMDYEKVVPAVVNIFGVLGVCPGVMVKDQSLESLQQTALAYILEHYPKEGGYSFKVTARRSNKDYPLNSQEISSEVGGYIFESMGTVTVDAHNPEVSLRVELRNKAYIYSKIINGYGGLPVGESGKATVLMSGGIDSPVAAWLTAKRGAAIEAVYFHSPPYTSERTKEKVADLCKCVSKYCGRMKLYVVPFTETQLLIYDNVPQERMTIFLKRAMLKAASKIADKNGSDALVCGDSIGQVASQTMQAINAINTAAPDYPVLRPLCTYDKQEIIDLARKIGTFEISIRPYEDCCTIFVAKHPEIRPKRHIIEKKEKTIPNLEETIAKAVDEAEVIDI